MVIAIVAKEVFKFAIKQTARYFATEKRAFNFLYRGFPSGFGRGVRHGLVGGSVIGNYITNEDLSNMNGVPVQQPNKARNPPYKTRGRFSRSNGSRYSSRLNGRKYSRCPRPRKY